MCFVPCSFTVTTVTWHRPNLPNLPQIVWHQQHGLWAHCATRHALPLVCDHCACLSLHIGVTHAYVQLTYFLVKQVVDRDLSASTHIVWLSQNLACASWAVKKSWVTLTSGTRRWYNRVNFLFSSCLHWSLGWVLSCMQNHYLICYCHTLLVCSQVCWQTPGEQLSSKLAQHFWLARKSTVHNKFCHSWLVCSHFLQRGKDWTE